MNTVDKVFRHTISGHCSNYITISDSWRQLGSKWDYSTNNHNDHGNSNFNGNNWIRFKEPAGVKLSNTYFPPFFCGAGGSGFMIGSEPTIVGQTLDRKLCFNNPGVNGCHDGLKNIKVSLCSGDNNEQFLIYQLPNPPAAPYSNYFNAYCTVPY